MWWRAPSLIISLLCSAGLFSHGCRCSNFVTYLIYNIMKIIMLLLFSCQCFQWLHSPAMIVILFLLKSQIHFLKVSNKILHILLLLHLIVVSFFVFSAWVCTPTLHFQCLHSYKFLSGCHNQIKLFWATMTIICMENSRQLHVILNSDTWCTRLDKYVIDNSYLIPIYTYCT